MIRLAMVGALAAMAGPAFAQAPVSLPRPAAGDSFVYAGKFATVACSRWTVTQVDRNGYNVRTCGGNAAYTLADNDALVRIIGPNGPLVQFDPASPGLEFPLALNKTWSARYAGFTADNGVHFASLESCKVSAWETVQTAAGALPAYRIDCEDHWTSGGASGQAHQASWYAPQAHTVVKVRNDQEPKWNLDLVSYSLHP